MENCWFCNTNQASHQFKVFLVKSTLKEVTTLEKKYSVSNIIKEIPRCNLCSNVHQFRDKREKMYLITFLLNVFLFFLLALIFTEQIGSIIEKLNKLNKVVGFILLMIIVLSPTIIILSRGILRRKKDEIKKWPQTAKKEIKSYKNSILGQHPKVSMYIKMGYEIHHGNLKKNKKL